MDELEKIMEKVDKYIEKISYYTTTVAVNNCNSTLFEDDSLARDCEKARCEVITQVKSALDEK